MIRILTLLVSLFSFGLVQLAEINYEIPVTDMLYFNDIEYQPTKNLFDKHTVIPNTFINHLTGTQTALAGFNSSDFIPVLPNTQYTTSNVNSNGAMYDASFNWDGVSGAIYSGTFTTRATTAYIRLSVPNANLTTAQLEQGATATSYAPYVLLSLNQIYDNPQYTTLNQTQLNRLYELRENPELNITYEINELDTQDLVLLLASQSVWTIMIHLLYKYAYRPKKKSKRLGM